jgi:hypothetical protein
MKLQRSIVTAMALGVVILLAWQAGVGSFVYSLFLPKDYIEACKSAGIRILQSPKTPVTSVVLDYAPSPIREMKRRYEFSFGGQLDSVGSAYWQPQVEEQIEVFEERTIYGPDKPDWQFFKFHGAKTRTLVKEMSAQVRVVDTIENSEEFQKPLWKQGMVKHHLKVTDLRNGDELAEMIYIVDLKNRRGCGVNAKNAIDVDAFILQTIAAPIIIPEWERQRREHAILKNW